MTAVALINPFFAARLRRKPRLASARVASASIEKRVIGNATLYRADCFDVLPTLSGIGAVVTDPPYGIGFQYRSYDDAPEKYDAMMERLVPELVRITGNGPCFVWQSPLSAFSASVVNPEVFSRVCRPSSRAGATSEHRWRSKRGSRPPET